MPVRKVTDPSVLSQLNQGGGVVAANPMFPGQVQGQQLNNEGQGLQNVHTRLENERVPLQNQNTQVQTQQTQQQVQFAPPKMGLDIKAQFDGNPYVKAYRDALPNAVSAMQAPDNAQGDLALVYAFGKVMDPGSVVREGELNMANQTSPLIGQLQSYIGMINAGKRLPKSTRVGLIEAIRAKSGEYNRAYTATREQYVKMAKAAGLDPDTVIGPHDAAPFQQTERTYIQRQTKGHEDDAGSVGFVNGKTYSQRNPEASTLLDSMIRQGVPYDQASQIMTATVPGAAPPDRGTYDKAVTFAKGNPGYKHSLGLVTEEKPVTTGQKIGSAIDSALGSGNLLGSFTRGGVEAWDRGANMLETGANALIPGLDSTSAHDAAQQHQDYFGNVEPYVNDQDARTAGRLVGSSVLAAPVKGPMAAGALGNLLMTDSSGTDAAKDAVVGAIGGKVLDVGLKGAAQLIAPELEKPVTNLAQEGAFLTPGRFFPRLKKAEDLARSYPVIGSKIDDAMNQTAASVSRIPLNRALGRVGQSLPDSVPAGHEATGYTQRTLGDLYDKTLSGTFANLDPTFVTRMNVLGQRANLRPQEFNELSDIVQREIGGAFQGKNIGQLTGRDFKRLDTRLGQISRGFQKNEDPYKQMLGDYVEQAQEQVRHLFRRQNPTQARTLRDLDNAWADFVPAQRASQMSIEDGIPTPGEYRNAVRQNDSSLRKGATARGEARLQDFAIDASKVVPAERPNSGTADRQNLASLKAWTLGSLLSPLYSEPSLATINLLAKRKPDPASKAIAKGLRLLPPGFGGAAVPLLINPGQ
jgi:hypothetical protein